MNRYLYAIRDRVAQDLVSLQMYSLMTFKTNEAAARYFADAINEESSILHKHPGDYELVLCGHVANDGKIQPTEKPEVIITGDALLALQQPALVKDA